MKKIIKWIVIFALLIILLGLIVKLKNEIVVIENFYNGEVESTYSLYGRSFPDVMKLDKYYKIDSTLIQIAKFDDKFILEKEFVCLDTLRWFVLDDSIRVLVPTGIEFYVDTLGVNFYSPNTFQSFNRNINPLEIEYSIFAYEDINFINMESQLKEESVSIKNSFKNAQIIESSFYNKNGVSTLKSIYLTSAGETIMIRKNIYRGDLYYSFSIRTQLMYYPFVREYIDVLLMHIRGVDRI